MRICDWEKTISTFVRQHPEGSSFEEVREGVNFKQYKSGLSFSQLMGSAVFHQVIRAKSSQGEPYDPNRPYNISSSGPLNYFPSGVV